MKPYLLAAAILLISGLMLGFVLPALFSAKSDGLVILGAAALLAYVGGTACMVRWLMISLKNRDHEITSGGRWKN